jgi:uncharacterized membrane protein YqjE
MGLRSVCPARLRVTHPRAVAVALLALSLLGLMLAVHWTLDDRFGGGHVVLGALFIVWAAQRAVESAWQAHARRVGENARQHAGPAR